MGTVPDRPAWRWASATSVGTSHGAAGLPCQDAIGAACFEGAGGSVFVGVACDGAGSAPLSGDGAALAVATVIENAGKFLEGNPLAEIDRVAVSHWIEAAFEAISARAATDGTAPEDYACTLLLALVGEDRATFAQIGDGATVFSDRESPEWACAFWPDRGEYENVTSFLTSAEARASFRFATRQGRLDALAMFTDGMENLVLQKAAMAVHGPFFDRVIVPVANAEGEGEIAALSTALSEYLGSPKVNARTDDDKSMILATRRRIDAASADVGGAA